MFLGGKKVRTQRHLYGIIGCDELKDGKFIGRFLQGSGMSKMWPRRNLLRIRDVLATATQTKTMAGRRNRHHHKGLGRQDSGGLGIPKPLLFGDVQPGLPDRVPLSQSVRKRGLREVLSAGGGGYGSRRNGFTYNVATDSVRC